MRRALAWIAAAVVAFAPRAAKAEEEAQLVYLRSAEAHSCPSEDVLHAAVVARVGRDPFVAGSPRTVKASLTRRGRAFVANVDLVDELGNEHGAHELSTNGACPELLDAVALAIAIAIDPRVLVAPSPAAPPTPPPPAAPPPPPPALSPAPVPAPVVDLAPLEPEHPVRVRRARTGVDASVGLLAATGEAPSPSMAVALGVSFRWGLFSLGAEGQLNAPAATSVPAGGSVSSWLVAGAVVPCAHAGALFACGVAQLGAMEASSAGVTDRRSISLAWRALGGRVGLLLPLRGSLLLRVHGDVVADVDRATLRLDEADAWRAPRAAGVLGADAVVRFQ